MATPSQPKILIVGAGPVGLCLACELARYRVPFRLIDKRSHPSETSKALAVHARSLELLGDMGLAERFIERGLPVARANIYANGKRLASVDLSEVDSPYNFTLDLPQSQTEALFIERLEQMNHPVERKVELTKLSGTGTGVDIELSSDGGALEHARFDYVVGCDGGHSTTRKCAGIEFVGQSYPERFALADVKISSSLQPGEMHLFFHRSGALALFPMRGERWRVIAEVDSDDNTELNESIIQQIINARADIPNHVSDGVWFSNFRIHRRLAAHYCAGRVFLAGDAAHQHSPAGGQGMNTGLQDAYNLGWKLALHHHGVVDLLDSYSAERQPIGHRVLEMTDRMTRVITMKNPVTTAIRDTVMPFVTSLGAFQHKVAESLEEVDINYRKSAVVGNFLGHDAPNATRLPFLHGPRGGDRAPNATLTASGDGSAKTLFELFQGTHFTLLIFTHANATGAELAEAKSLAETAAKRLGPWVECAFISDRQAPTELRSRPNVYLDARLSAHQTYGVSKARATYLIRPDGYVAFRSTPLSQQALETYLDHIGIRAE